MGVKNRVLGWRTKATLKVNEVNIKGWWNRGGIYVETQN